MTRRGVQPRCIKAAASAHVVTAHAIILREFFAMWASMRESSHAALPAAALCADNQSYGVAASRCAIIAVWFTFHAVSAKHAPLGAISGGVRVLRTIGNPTGSCHRSSCTHDVVCHEASTKSLKQVGAWRLLIVQAQAAAHTNSQLVASNQSKVESTVAEGVCTKICRCDAALGLEKLESW